MTLSKEYQEYHLTPKGWVEGTFKGDTLGATSEVEIPDERVLTIRCYDVTPSLHSKPYFYDKITWECSDKDLISKLKMKYGDKPDWFGYAKMENQV